jgi:hypothetical protein
MNGTEFDLDMYVTTLIGKALRLGVGTAEDLRTQFDVLGKEQSS